MAMESSGVIYHNRFYAVVAYASLVAGWATSASVAAISRLKNDGEYIFERTPITEMILLHIPHRIL